MDRTPAHRHQLQAALLAAFPTRAARAQLVAYALDQSLAAIAGEGPLTEVVFRLLEWATAHDQIRALVEGALRANPTNPTLQAFAATLDQPPPAAGPTATGAAPNREDILLEPKQRTLLATVVAPARATPPPPSRASDRASGLAGFVRGVLGNGVAAVLQPLLPLLLAFFIGGGALVIGLTFSQPPWRIAARLGFGPAVGLVLAWMINHPGQRTVPDWGVERLFPGAAGGPAVNAVAELRDGATPLLVAFRQGCGAPLSWSRMRPGNRQPPADPAGGWWGSGFSLSALIQEQGEVVVAR